jgi:hypothetical protein
MEVHIRTLNGTAIPLKCVCARALAATGISKRMLTGINKKGKNTEKTIAVFS